jgi:Ferritin-like
MDTPVDKLPSRHLGRLRAVKHGDWTPDALREHLQYAVDLELWTIPFYMSAMYSIRDAGTEASELIRSVMNQEMLHMQLAANVANAFGCDVVVRPPVYGQGVPHIDFALDDPDPRTFFHPYSSEIGPLDVARVNAMCLVEYPSTAREDEGPDDEYGSIGAFYAALQRGTEELACEIQGNRNQVDLFAQFYPKLQATITKDGVEGLPQVRRLFAAIVDQGEGALKRRDPGLDASHEALAGFIPSDLQNLATDPRPASTHFEKFVYLRNQPLPATWAVQFTTPAGAEAQARLAANFACFCAELEALFRGGGAEAFGPAMFTLGGNIRVCWQNGVAPTFS